MKVLDLFSGIGGFSLGLERVGMETVAFCEIENYPRKVLAKHWPSVPIASDITKLTYSDGVLFDDGQEIYRGSIDLVCGGFPCQDLSTAGRQKGLSAERSGLFYEMCRVIGEVRPRYAIFENVTNLLNGGGGEWFESVLWEISALGYDAEWHCIPASELGAHHHRDRVWIIAYPDSTDSGNKRETMGRRNELVDRGETVINNNGKQEYVAYPQRQRQIQCKHERRPRHKQGVSSRVGVEISDSRKQENVADTISSRQQEQGELEQSLFAEAYRKGETINAFSGGTPDIWKTEPQLGRVADGIPNRSHRLKGLGNAVVPQIPEIIGRAVMEAEGL